MNKFILIVFSLLLRKQKACRNLERSEKMVMFNATGSFHLIKWSLIMYLLLFVTSISKALTLMLITQILDNWRYHKSKVASYWLVKLDSTKQRKVSRKAESKLLG